MLLNNRSSKLRAFHNLQVQTLHFFVQQRFQIRTAILVIVCILINKLFIYLFIYVSFLHSPQRDMYFFNEKLIKKCVLNSNQIQENSSLLRLKIGKFFNSFFVTFPEDSRD